MDLRLTFREKSNNRKKFFSMERVNMTNVTAKNDEEFSSLIIKRQRIHSKFSMG